METINTAASVKKNGSHDDDDDHVLVRLNPMFDKPQLQGMMANLSSKRYAG